MVHVAIVGAYGSAGSAVADELAAVPDVELTLVDDGDPGGGLCILRGCMPSKEVLSAATHRFRPRHDHRVEGTPAVDLEAVVATKDRHVAEFAEHRRSAVRELARREDVRFLRGTARFVDDCTLRVRGAEGGPHTIEPDYVVIATGSTVSVPELPGLDAVDYSTSADVLDAESLPDSGIVMGFGYVGLELVPYVAEAGGTDLTVIEHDARPLEEADPAFGDDVLALYREQFDVDVRTHTYEQRVEPTADGGVRLHVERRPPATDGRGEPPAESGETADRVETAAADAATDGDAGAATDADADAATAADAGAGDVETIEADELFLFTGRRPDLDDLALENTALEPGPGWVRDTMQAVDDERVFVVGDANAREPILHVAKEQGIQAAENVLAHADGEPLVPYENVHHHVVFTALSVYPYVRIGHSVASAEAADLEYVAVSRAAREDGVFRAKDVPEGRATLVVGTDGTVLGYQGLHYHADAMAKTMQVVVELGLDVQELPKRAYHPTTPEILDGLFREAVAALEE